MISNRSLISLQDGKDHLRVRHDDADTDITNKIAEASELVLQHAKIFIIPAEWMTGSPLVMTVPFNLRAATKLVLGELYENREASISNPLTESVKGLIDRDPTMA